MTENCPTQAIERMADTIAHRRAVIRGEKDGTESLHRLVAGGVLKSS